MRGIMKLGGLLALMGSPAMADIQKAKPCLTQAEASSMFVFMMPEALAGVAKTCQPSLPATSYLTSKSGETVARFRTAASGSWPQAKLAFFKLGGVGDDELKLMSGLSDKALQPLVSETIAGVISKDIKPADCPKIDRFVAALAPLPAANVAELMTALVGLVGNKDNDDFNLCRE